MWPTTSTYRPFGDVACPAGAHCTALRCIFLHDSAKPLTTRPSTSTERPLLEDGRQAKRIRLDSSTETPASQADDVPPTRPLVFVGSLAPKGARARGDAGQGSQVHTTAKPFSVSAKSDLPRSVTQPVSPPTKPSVVTPVPKPDLRISLTPQKLGKDPAGFPKRLTYLKVLRQYMALLNDQVSKIADPDVKAFHLTDNQLNKAAVDEEARIAVQHYSVYENVFKQRLVALKKMAPEAWIEERKKAHAKGNGEQPTPKPRRLVKTGLTSKEEVILLSKLISSPDGLGAHGYVTEQPTPEQMLETREALISADHWEECERCGTRFQVFPDRREEDGALTTGGQCRHHWGRKVYPNKVKGQSPGPTRYSCCNEPLGSEPCSVHDTHVFKVTGAKRLSAIMPFVHTPPNESVEPHAAVCFDCEMGYTTQGLELLRLTAVSWPTHKLLLDILVRPLGHLLDLNTRFSGVSPDQYFNAVPFDPNTSSVGNQDLRIVSSPNIARDLFLSYISPTTPVIGHALENDLNTIRLIHPTIVDTVLLYPHRSGLPYRMSLKNLTKSFLGVEIQQAGAAGHDSFEDARATGELVRHRVASVWKNLKNQGWMIVNEHLCPPLPSESPPPLPAEPMEAFPGGKRKLDQYEEEQVDSQEITKLQE